MNIHDPTEDDIASYNAEGDTFAYDVRRAAQLLMYMPEANVIRTLGRSMPIEHAFLITKAAYIFLADALKNMSQGEA